MIYEMHQPSTVRPFAVRVAGRADPRRPGTAATVSDRGLADESSSAPNYAARRLGALFVALVVLFSVAQLASTAWSSVAGQPASAAAAGDHASSNHSSSNHASSNVAAAAVDTAAGSHVAESGDTLWSIADEHRGEVSRERFVDALVRLNEGTQIVVGQAVLLP